MESAQTRPAASIGNRVLSLHVEKKAAELLGSREWMAAAKKLCTFYKARKVWRRYQCKSLQTGEWYFPELCPSTGEFRCTCLAGQHGILCGHVEAFAQLEMRNAARANGAA